MPWRWRNVRKANIPKHERDTFERYGESIIGAILVGGLTPRAPDLQAVYQNEEIISHARDWLTERGDSRERHENRLETVEWAILIFVVLSVILELLARFFPPSL
jgi:hypothetical protein